MEKSKDFKAQKFGNILTARPEGMSYEKYKQERMLQHHRLKERLRGFIVWRSQYKNVMSPSGEVIPGGEAWGTLTGKVPNVRIK